MTSPIAAIMVDSREPKSIQQMNFDNVPVAVTQLQAGDLWASCADGEMVIIERKTPSDLLGSIGDNRLFTQVSKMRDLSKWCYIVITGVIRPTRDGMTYAGRFSTGWNWDSVQGALLTAQEMGVGIVQVYHEREYPNAVLRLAQRKRSAERVTPPVAASRIMNHGEQILTSLPGIGLERAQAILAAFDEHPGRALEWLTWMGTWGEVAGIGEGIKTNIRHALRLDDGEELCVMTPNSYVNDSLVRRAEREKAA